MRDITKDDRLFCMFVCADDNVKCNRIVCYLYVFQEMGFNLGFRYKVGNGGISSRDVDNYMNELLGNGLLSMKNHTLLAEISLDEAFLEYPLDYQDLCALELVLQALRSLDDEDLRFMCLTNLVTHNVHEKVSFSDYSASREMIVNILKSQSTVYSDENFDASLKVMNLLREYRDNLDNEDRQLILA